MMNTSRKLAQRCLSTTHFLPSSSSLAYIQKRWASTLQWKAYETKAPRKFTTHSAISAHGRVILLDQKSFDFDPSDGQFRPLTDSIPLNAPLKATRSGKTTSILMGKNFWYVNKACEYDSVNKTFKNFDQPKMEKGFQIASTNGQVFALGETYFTKNNNQGLQVFALSSDLKWDHVVPDGPNPLQGKDVLAVGAGRNLVVITGSVGTEGQDTNSFTVHLLDTHDMVWSKPEVKGKAAPRTGASACVLQDTDGKDKVIIFGGRPAGGISLGGVSNTISVLDLTTMQWEDSVVQGPNPPPRQGHTLTSYNKHSALLIGGNDPNELVGGFLDDVYSLTYVKK
eukprot:TRINITY_DN1642_c0_g1_i1.p1 TRINITY_DN1642_c0_g1~~TRINITY_DN1642_c0_g1_i1.p1  ORF type:complete len:339 (-),score=100.27 TRINITY_DN1642_c0_g1_i1:19-1035(-)